MHTVSHRRYTNTCKIALSAIACLLTLFGSQASAQSLFDGIPDPSMANYATMWGQITGVPYRQTGSSLVLGNDLGDGTHDLIAVQPTDANGNFFLEPVGSIALVTTYDDLWVLPDTHDLSLSTNTFSVTIRVTLTTQMASAIISTDLGLVSPAVVSVTTITIEIIDGYGADVIIGDSGTYRAITPLGLVSDAVDADLIAERIAVFAVYDGLPIDPNSAPMADPGGDVIPIYPDDMLCQARCQNSYDTELAICDNNLHTAVRNCHGSFFGGAVGGCGLGLTFCGAFPFSTPVCCVGGALIGGWGTYGICRRVAQNSFHGCKSNAYERFRLCMLNECGIVIYEE